MHPYPTTVGGGIYAITHVATGRQYIGSAKRLDRRWAIHLRQLNAGKHDNPRLGHAWQAYGAEAFTFSVLEAVSDPAQLLSREQHYIDTLRPYYNLAPTAGSMLGFSFSAESKAKISASLMGRPLGPFTEEHKQRISAGRKSKGLGVPSPHKRWRNAFMTQDERSTSATKRGARGGTEMGATPNAYRCDIARTKEAIAGGRPGPRQRRGR